MFWQADNPEVAPEDPSSSRQQALSQGPEMEMEVKKHRDSQMPQNT